MARYNKVEIFNGGMYEEKIRILFWYGLIGVAEG